MAAHPYLLEHEILKVLYNYISFGIRGEGKMGKTTPVFKRDYEYSSLHFGTLVDILNSPEKYTNDKMPIGVIGWLKNLSVTYEEVIPEAEMKYQWAEVSEALEVLALNNHIKETPVEIHIYSDNMKRVVYLKNEGALAFRNNYYLKEAEIELSIARSYEIQKRDLWLKKYWIGVEISKYVMGGIVGALIALGLARLNKSKESKSENTTTKQGDTVSSPKTASYPVVRPSNTIVDTVLKQAIR
ncbi:hypothetical protein CAP36_00125 [Chitinophagaceae bacterium IBVUCB2]|nr:hypothetical protein CAP36_00125 [Chitinophagaceae bacterium IBVUCB2]